MNSLISIDELLALASDASGTCVSIYLPTHKLGTQTQKDPIRFKNLMRKAGGKLASSGMRVQDARNLLASAQAIDNYQFWQHQSDGLALFICANVFGYYCLPLNFDELVVVSDRFHLKPLMPLLSGDGQFYILALSQNQVRLCQGTRYSVSEIGLKDVPTSIAEALQYDDPEKSLQFHTGTSGGADRTAMFHGHGAGNDYRKDELLRYFRRVDSGLQELLKTQRAPLVLVGVDYLLPIYHQANTYPYLLDEGITRNPDELKAEELHAQVWKIVQPHFEQAIQEAEERYQTLVGTGKTAANIQEIVSAAYYQRIESLFVTVGQQKWGRFNSETGTVQVLCEPEPGDQDLMDLAALHTILNRGAVYAVEPEEVPGNAPIAAVLRY